LQPEYASYIFALLPAPAFLLRTVPTWLGLRRQNAWDQYHQEHHRRAGLLGSALDRLFALELEAVRRGRSIVLGASCLVVARKS
jgi:hypothetical protein